MKKLRKVLVFISVVLAGVFSAFGVYSALDSDFLYKIGAQINGEPLFSGLRLGILFISLIFLVFVITILFTFKNKEKTKEAIKIANAGGTVSISAQTIETLAKLEARNTENIYDIRTDVVDTDTKPIVEVRAKVPPTVSIPAISVQLQENIRNKIMETTGTDIENVRIMIDGIIDPEKK
ncbi:MAG: alkaline shock response membrane anchor protein AmaP [Clostridiales bacterium]|nr:alkaline shock response membrane anchor protein AmaP [Clostridiales bacterium]